MNATLLLSVAAGGAIGSVLRYATLLFVTKYSDIPSYFATLLVNITGSFASGCIVAVVSSMALT